MSKIIPAMILPVIAYAPIPTTMPNIASKPFKSSAPEFIVVIKILSDLLRVLRSGIANDFLY